MVRIQDDQHRLRPRYSLAHLSDDRVAHRVPFDEVDEVDQFVFFEGLPIVRSNFDIDANYSALPHGAHETRIED